MFLSLLRDMYQNNNQISSSSVSYKVIEGYEWTELNHSTLAEYTGL